MLIPIPFKEVLYDSAIFQDTTVDNGRQFLPRVNIPVNGDEAEGSQQVSTGLGGSLTAAEGLQGWGKIGHQSRIHGCKSLGEHIVQ